MGSANTEYYWSNTEYSRLGSEYTDVNTEYSRLGSEYTEYYRSEYWILEVGKWIYWILLKWILNTHVGKWILLKWILNTLGWEVNIPNITEVNTECSRLGSKYTEYYWSEYWILYRLGSEYTE